MCRENTGKYRCEGDVWVVLAITTRQKPWRNSENSLRGGTGNLFDRNREFDRRIREAIWLLRQLLDRRSPSCLRLCTASSSAVIEGLGTVFWPVSQPDHFCIPVHIFLFDEGNPGGLEGGLDGEEGAGMGRASAALEVDDGALGDLGALGQDIAGSGEYGTKGIAKL
jgi:hypothetical protein